MSQEIADVVPEPPSGEVVLEPETPSGLSEADVDDGGPAEPAGEGEGPADASAGEPQPDREAPKGSPERKAYEKLESKFLHIADPEERREAIAQAYWRKTNYASGLRKDYDRLEADNRDLRARLEKLEHPAEPAVEEQPHPDVVAIDNRIQAIYAEMQEIQKENTSRLADLTKYDREAAIAEDRLKDSFDEQKPAWEAKLERAKDKYELVRIQYKAAYKDLDRLNRELAQQLGNKDWVERFAKQKKAQQQTEQGERETAYREFPGLVDSRITTLADAMGIPDEDRIRHACWKHVNRALMVELRRVDVDDVRPHLDGWIKSYIKEFADERDIVTRTAFTERSREKLRVTTRAATTAGARIPQKDGRSVPRSSLPAVPVALLSNDATPQMLRARENLIRRLSGGAAR